MLKSRLSAIFILMTAMTVTDGFADDFFGEARCRAGAIQGQSSRELADSLCADVKTEADGICRAGFLAQSLNGETAREACADVKTEAEARCRARILFRYGNVKSAREGCRPTEDGFMDARHPVGRGNVPIQPATSYGKPFGDLDKRSAKSFDSDEL